LWRNAPAWRIPLSHDNIATTSGYLHARPDGLSGLNLKLNPGADVRHERGNLRDEMAGDHCRKPWVQGDAGHHPREDTDLVIEVDHRVHSNVG
jgi:hypothetical protein